MRTTTKMLLSVCGLILLANVVGAVVSVVYGLPTEFVLGGEPGNPDNVLGDILSGKGAALVAPPGPLIALILFMVLARSRRWWGTLGVVGICLVAVLSVNGIFGEPLTWETIRSPASNIVVAAVVALSILLVLLVLLLGIVELVGRVRRRKRATAEG